MTGTAVDGWALYHQWKHEQLDLEAAGDALYAAELEDGPEVEDQ